MSPEITIRRAETVADYQACQEAQRHAWGLTEERYVIPVATMVGAQLHGGLVLGAFVPGGEAVGMSFAFLGWVEGRLGLYSQLTGVVPGYQDRGIGSRLKHAQRDVAREEGLDCIAWAFDPLQAGNARFNLAKLGATCGRYVVDMYGPRTDALNRGTPTDRLIAVWDIDAEVPDRAVPEPGRLPRWLEAGEMAGGRAEPRAGVVEAGCPRSLLEIPPDIGALRRTDPEFADRWRLAVREAFLAAFAAGYRAADFLREDSAGQRRAFYLLEPQRSDSSAT